ncbi:MAG TPA: hypothetical protein P5121_38795, partial [Caldilineaceae bacterium]|nr:hypothetical protein [Caldilineaceae bacterium]
PTVRKKLQRLLDREKNLELKKWAATGLGNQISDPKNARKALEGAVKDFKRYGSRDDPTDPESGYSDLDPEGTYVVATTNFQALIAADYKEIFAAAEDVTNTEININELVIDYIRENSPVAADVDGRVNVVE